MKEFGQDTLQGSYRMTEQNRTRKNGRQRAAHVALNLKVLNFNLAIALGVTTIRLTAWSSQNESSECSIH